MDQYRAFVIFHRARAEVLGCLDAKDYGLALNYIRQAESEIRSFYQEQGKDEFFDSSEEIAQIRQWKERIESLRPLTKMEFLESQLQRAVEREEYERAAQIRDEIKRNIRKGRV
jgi:protein-arginine kinase activator protein McsA